MNISVLMAVHAKENPLFLRQAIESIWDSQSLKPDEIILIEDGKLSNDLYTILDIFGKKLGKKLDRIPLKENQGLTKALNIGIEHCKGKYIARMDSDDISAPNRFEAQFKFMEKNPEVDALGGYLQDIDEENRFLQIRKYPSNISAIKKYIAKASPLAHASVMFRKSLFDSGIRYDDRYMTSQDLELWFRLIYLNCSMHNLTEIIYYQRISNSMIKRRSYKKALNEFRIYTSGIKTLYGYSPLLIYPFLRLLVRLAPLPIICLFYKSRLRHFLDPAKPANENVDAIPINSFLASSSSTN